MRERNLRSQITLLRTESILVLRKAALTQRLERVEPERPEARIAEHGRFAGQDDVQGAQWKTAPEDVADVVLSLLRHDPRSLPSRVELRPSKPRK